MTTENKVNNTLMLLDVLLARAYLEPGKPYRGKPDPKTGAMPVPKYRIEAIVPPSHPQLADIKRLMREAAQRQWKDDTDKVLKVINASDKLALHRGDVTRSDSPEYAGNFYLVCTNKDHPTIVGVKNGQKARINDDPTNPTFPFAGCRANISIDFFPYTTGSNGISSGLKGVQLVKIGPRLGGGSKVASADEFGVVPVDADSAPPADATDDSGLI